MKLQHDFKEFLQLLNENKVMYLIVGGYAVAMHGYVRSTGDIDIWIKNNRENAKKLLKVLYQFGFKSLNIVIEDIKKNDQIIQLGYPPYRIDIITSLEGLSFNVCYKKCIRFQIEKNFKINLIDLESLKISKLKAGRSRDLDDLENLK
jgi:hypothetical protein